MDERPAKMLPLVWVTFGLLPQIACLAAELPGRDWREDASRRAGDVRDQVGA